MAMLDDSSHHLGLPIGPLVGSNNNNNYNPYHQDPSLRAKSMEFLGDDGHGHQRALSEHELRIQRSLQKLDLPEWYRNSPLFQATPTTAPPPPPSPLHPRWIKAGQSKAIKTKPRWQDIRSRSRSTSSSNLGGGGGTQQQQRAPQSSRESLVQSPISPSLSWGTATRWSSSRLSTTPSASSRSASPSAASSSGSSYWHAHHANRQPYLGWRSSERLARDLTSPSFYRSAAERLSQGPGYYALRFGCYGSSTSSRCQSQAGSEENMAAAAAAPPPSVQRWRTRRNSNSSTATAPPTLATSAPCDTFLDRQSTCDIQINVIQSPPSPQRHLLAAEASSPSPPPQPTSRQMQMADLVREIDKLVHKNGVENGLVLQPMEDPGASSNGEAQCPAEPPPLPPPSGGGKEKQQKVVWMESSFVGVRPIPIPKEEEPPPSPQPTPTPTITKGPKHPPPPPSPSSPPPSPEENTAHVQIHAPPAEFQDSKERKLSLTSTTLEEVLDSLLALPSTSQSPSPSGGYLSGNKWASEGSSSSGCSNTEQPFSKGLHHGPKDPTEGLLVSQSGLPEVGLIKDHHGGNSHSSTKDTGKVEEEANGSTKDIEEIEATASTKDIEEVEATGSTKDIKEDLGNGQRSDNDEENSSGTSLSSSRDSGEEKASAQQATNAERGSEESSGTDLTTVVSGSTSGRSSSSRSSASGSSLSRSSTSSSTSSTSSSSNRPQSPEAEAPPPPPPSLRELPATEAAKSQQGKEEVEEDEDDDSPFPDPPPPEVLVEAQKDHRRVSLDDTVIVRCSNALCRETAQLRDAQRIFKTCHNCYTYYCSRECRKVHWDIHRKVCMHVRIQRMCKEVIQSAIGNSIGHLQLSKLARMGYTTQGRGFVKVVFRNTDLALKFLKQGGPGGGGGPLPLEDAPIYVAWNNLIMQELGEEVYRSVVDLCKSYDPDTKMVLLVAIFVTREVPLKKVPHWERETIAKCAKVSLSKDLFEPSNDPLILTGMPSSPLKAGFSNTGASATSQRATREACFGSIQEQLRTRGVSLRQQFPDVYRRLCSFVENDDPFPPLTIYPKDGRTGSPFMCVIMPNSAPSRPTAHVQKAKPIAQPGKS